MTTRRIGATRRIRPEAQHGLRRDIDVVTLDDRAQKATEDLLALTTGVHVSGVDEVAPRLDVLPQLLRGVVLVGVLTPRHRAEREVAHRKAAVTEVAQFHNRRP